MHREKSIGNEEMFYLLWHSAAAIFNRLLRVRLGENDDRIKLGVVELVHGVGRDVEEGVVAPVHDLPDSRQSHDGAAVVVRSVSLRRRKLARVILEKSISGNVGHRPEDDDRPVEARVSQTHALVRGEL